MREVMLLDERLLRIPITGTAGCCARAASGHPTAETTVALTKSRRRIASPKGMETVSPNEITAGLATRGMGFNGRFAQQQLQANDVRYGSLASFRVLWPDVSYYPNSDRKSDLPAG